MKDQCSRGDWDISGHNPTPQSWYSIKNKIEKMGVGWGEKENKKKGLCICCSSTTTTTTIALLVVVVVVAAAATKEEEEEEEEIVCHFTVNL